MVTGAVLPGLLVGLAVLLRAPLPRSRRSRGGVVADAGGRRAAVPDAAVPDVVVIDLVCAALAAGLPTASAVAAAHAVAGGPRPPAGVALTRALALADRTGASAAVLLQRVAADERAARRRRVAAATGRLGVRLVIPLGLTVLPAFLLLGVVPVVLGLGRQILQGP